MHLQTWPHIVTAPICHHLKPKLEQRGGNVWGYILISRQRKSEFYFNSFSHSLPQIEIPEARLGLLI